MTTPTAPAGQSSTSQAGAQQEQVTFLPPSHWAQAQAEADAEEDNTDADSAISAGQYSTESITDSIRHYRTINGRTYHREVGSAEYWQSNDEQANEVIDIFHHVQYLLEGEKLFLAPLKKDIKKVLDVGTGTGIWAIEFAEEFPNTEVIGIDVSPIQPKWVPDNLQFQIDDCTLEWTFEPNSLDYVHIRFLSGSIPDWTRLFEQAYRCLKPGGYIESMEPSPIVECDDGTINDKSAMSQWGKIFIQGGINSGRTWTVVRDHVQEKAMKEAGFTEVEATTWKVPISPWPKDPKQKEIGGYFRACMEQDLQGIIEYTATVLGDWSKEEIMVYAAQVRREIRQLQNHGYFWQRNVVGRKPLTSS